jgi:NUMOD3 motif
VRPDTGLIFYVGKGRGSRAHDNRRSFRFKRVVEKLKRSGLKPTCHFMARGLTENQAFNYETVAIGQLRAIGVPLVNLTNGGEGASGLVMSASARKKVSEARKGVKFSDEHRAKLSAAKKGRKLSPEHIAKLRAGHVPMTSERAYAMLAVRHAKPVSEETKAKLRTAALAQHCKARERSDVL